MTYGGCCAKKKSHHYHHWSTGSLTDRFTSSLYSCLEQNTRKVTLLPNSTPRHNFMWENGCIAPHILNL